MNVIFICLLLTPAALAFQELLVPPLEFHAAQTADLLHHAQTAARFTSSIEVAKDAHTSTATLNPLNWYMNTLTTNPLATKMFTGASLALCADWIAQSRAPEEDYDKRRAASFALFDSAYRASQHILYPIVVQHCQGQFLGHIPALPLEKMSAAALEQTLVSQLVIVPLLYYPVFYGVTSFVQGLDWQGTIERAQQTFVPLMKRNLLFWIPVQFIQFSWLPQDLQIPFLSLCGLCWTLILSAMAGSAKEYAAETPGDEQYCISGMEQECVIGEDGLFPHASLEEITEEMKEIAQDVTNEWDEITHGIGQVLGSTEEEEGSKDACTDTEQSTKQEDLAMRK